MTGSSGPGTARLCRSRIGDDTRQLLPYTSQCRWISTTFGVANRFVDMSVASGAVGMDPAIYNVPSRLGWSVIWNEHYSVRVACIYEDLELDLHHITHEPLMPIHLGAALLE
jgi:hypothetical protein